MRVTGGGCHHFGVTPSYDQNSNTIGAKKVLGRCYERQRKKNIKAFAAKRDFLLCNYRPHSIVTIHRISHCLLEAREKICGSLYPYIDAFICDRKWKVKTRILGKNFYLQYQLYSVRMYIPKMKRGLLLSYPVHMSNLCGLVAVGFLHHNQIFDVIT